MMKFRHLILSITILTLSWIPTAEANVVYSANAHTQIVSEYSSVRPGQTFRAAIHFKMDPNWHIYWRNPGDSGIPPKIEWELPEGVTAGEFQWPMPEFIPVDPLMTYGYHGEVLLPFQVNIPTNYNNSEIILKGKLEYLACEIICVPGKADLELMLPIKTIPDFDMMWSPKIKGVDLFLPDKFVGGEVKVYDDDSHYLIEARLEKEPKQLYFFPYQDDIINHYEAQPFSYQNGTARLRVVKSDYHPDQLDFIQGILSIDKLNHSEFKVLISEMSKGEVHQDSLGFWLALFFAFLGGIILNLMPCVLPVLSIKILNIVQLAKDNRTKIVKDGFLFSFGIISAFWVLAILLILLKSAGQEIGWGFQFQSPAFVIAMIVLFTTLALNLFGVFEIGVNMNRLSFMQKGGAFWEGVLATIVATPCTAPFMGSALGYALTQSATVSFLIFTFLGIGLATPFLLLILFPSLMKFVPKPGPWMVHLKRFFGVVFLLTVAWLFWILSLQVNIPFISHTKSESLIEWQEFSPELIEQYRNENKIVFLDFTARWCLTCQVNEGVAFSSEELANKFKELDVMTVKADWTNYDEDITKALADLGRNAIPLYVLYPKNKGEPVLLPELITPNIVMEYLKNVQNE